MLKSLFVLVSILVSATAWATTPKVESRVSEIPTYNSQASALTFMGLCKIFMQGNVDLGKSAQVTCQVLDGGVVEFKSADPVTKLSATILGNATDKLVIEFFGSDEIHYYKNNLGQSLMVKFEFVAAQRRTLPGGVEDGTYRVDIGMTTAEGRFRFGYYFNKKN